MTDTVDYGIDLGTTNSLIARCVGGEAQVFKNPAGFKDTLPSVVWIRKDAIIVGDKAYERLERDSLDVFSRFKRRMGTTESFPVHAQPGKSITPHELSSCVLKELRGFVQTNTGSSIDAAVITVPASFDATQSNATLDAARMAGFRQAILLQEPIAASLAFVNQRRDGTLPDGKWLVYDLGGGTFDLALVSVAGSEMRILDHVGDNFLGGGDFDDAIVQSIVVPYLSSNFELGAIAELRSASSRYNSLYLQLLHKAEEAKVELSAHLTAEIEVEFEDIAGRSQDVFVPVARSQFARLVEPRIDRTVGMIRELLTRNNLIPTDMQFLLMVGGSTYVPAVRERVAELSGVRVSSDIDPVTAVALGAAYYAGTRQRKIASTPELQGHAQLQIRTAYNRTSLEKSEPIAVAIDGETTGLFYRITRQDGGFDTGLKRLQQRVYEDLPLVAHAENVFAFSVLDTQGTLLPTSAREIEILQGVYDIPGQPLPEDICLESDSFDLCSTKLELIFGKGTTLPVQRPMTVRASKSLIKGSSSDLLLINVYEGPQISAPAACKRIGALEIHGADVARDIIKGSDIELMIREDESRTLTVMAHVTMTDQTFQQVFKPSYRCVDLEKLRDEVASLGQEVAGQEATEDSTLERSQVCQIEHELQELQARVLKIDKDDTSDEKYQLDNRRRELFQKWTALSAPRKCAALHREYQATKKETQSMVTSNGNDNDRKALADLLAREDSIMISTSSLYIQEAIDELQMLGASIAWRTPSWLAGLFSWISERRNLLNESDQTAMLLESGQAALSRRDYNQLALVDSKLVELLPNEQKQQVQHGSSVGITM